MKNWILMVSLVTGLAGCAGADPTEMPVAATPEAEENTAVAAREETAMASPADLGVINMRMPAEGLITGGQLSQDQVTALMAMGYSTFVSLRPADEGDDSGWEETFMAEGEGTFVRIPVASAADLTAENAALLAGALETGQADGGTVVYCKSGNRVGALLALKAAWIDGVDAETAMAFGRDAGVTRLEPAVMKALGLSE